jgi:hypothetical protein
MGQRHIRAARLEDTQEADDHLNRAFDADGHYRVGPDSEVSEMVRKSIGALSQLCPAGFATSESRQSWRLSQPVALH